jgi:argininosuccinate lyase
MTSPKNDVWSGRLPGGLDPRARALNDSLPVDQRLWPEEIALTRAYGPSLVECGILDASGLRSLLAAADALEADLSAGRVTLEGEDVHSAVESGWFAAPGDRRSPAHRAQPRQVREHARTACA